MKIMHIHKHCLLTVVHMLGTSGTSGSGTSADTAGAVMGFEPLVAVDIKAMEYIFKYLRVKLPKCDAGIVRFFVQKLLTLLGGPYSLYMTQEILIIMRLKK